MNNRNQVILSEYQLGYWVPPWEHSKDSMNLFKMCLDDYPISSNPISKPVAYDHLHDRDATQTLSNKSVDMSQKY